MRSAHRRAALFTALTAALSAPLASHAVRLDADGLGQALIFPYYSAQTALGDSLNTYVSVVNHTSDAKAVRVRFREGRMGAEVQSFNLFLAPNDVWTGALGPTADGTRLVTADTSCTDPAFTPSGPIAYVDFRNTAYSGANDDGAGTGLDRTREGYVEMIEMATLTGASAAAVTPDVTGIPLDCAAVRAGAAVSVGAPSGNLSGGLTLINVANGMEFSTNAEALAELSKAPFYRPASDPYPDWNASEIQPVSAVVANGAVYRSAWSRPVDAVSAVLMRSSWEGEFVLDNGTASLTDFVLTFPTRRFYANPASFSPPFSAPALWQPHCAPFASPKEPLTAGFFDREGRVFAYSNPDGAPMPAPPAMCAASVVVPVANGDSHTPSSPDRGVLGSRNGGFAAGVYFLLADSPQLIQDGWLRFAPATATPLVSSAASQRLDGRMGTVSSGSHAYSGLPVVGFMVRSFTNGFLTCNAGTCQGNYGGAFPLRFQRSIGPVSP